MYENFKYPMQIIQQVSKDLKISKLLLNFNQYSISTFRATLKKVKIHANGFTNTAALEVIQSQQPRPG